MAYILDKEVPSSNPAVQNVVPEIFVVISRYLPGDSARSHHHVAAAQMSPDLGSNSLLRYCSADT